MKKLIACGFLALAMLSLGGCGNDKKIDGKNYEVYGLFNEVAVKDPDIRYEVSPGSVIVAVIFSETVVVPIYVIGWDLYEPVRHN